MPEKIFGAFGRCPIPALRIHRFRLALMGVRFANSYVDHLFAERDLGGLYHLITVVARERPLPEEFWLFCRVYEWAPARSGVWQYYEGLPDEKFQQMVGALERFGLAEIAEKYRLGKTTWNSPDHAAALDAWLDSHAQEIHDAIFRLVASQKEYLKDES
jgi:hypothetical protein